MSMFFLVLFKKINLIYLIYFIYMKTFGNAISLFNTKRNSYIFQDLFYIFYAQKYNFYLVMNMHSICIAPIYKKVLFVVI